MAKKKKKIHQEVEQPLLAHLIELRQRLIRSLLAIFIVFLCLLPFANDIFNALAVPLLDYYLSAGASIIATEVASTFLIPFKTVLVFSFFIAVPVVLYHFWAFVAPGLYQNERKVVLPLLISSSLLFYLGMAFSFFVVLRLALTFLKAYAPSTVEIMTDISHYYNFILKMFFAFGMAFEVPVATFILVWTGITSVDSLAQKRPYIIVGSFVVGMLLTPPDVISQILLAVPMWILFEVGLLASKYFIKHKAEYGTSDDENDQPMSDGDMESELDKIEQEENGSNQLHDPPK